MAKKKASWLVPVVFAAVAALLFIMFFLPTAAIGVEVAGHGVGDRTTFSGLDSVIALFSGELNSDMSAGVAAAYGFKEASATSASFGATAVCWLILALVSLATMVLSVLAIFSKNKKVLFGKLFMLVLAVLSLVILISTIAMIAQWNGQRFAGTVTKASIHMASILAFVFGLGGAASAYLLKK